MLKQTFSVLTSAILAICSANFQPLSSKADQKLVDSGIDYTESTETLLNPGMGYTSTLWYKCKPNNTPVHDPKGALVLMFIDIGGFSSGINGERDTDGNLIEGTGTDYPLDEMFFTNLRQTFENARNNGCTIAVRFRYDEIGLTNPEPATYEFMLSHVQQIKESRILDDYKDILMYVESGLVGCYGEQWGGKYCSTETKAELLDLWLDVVPDDIPVTVRTPNIFAKWADIPVNEMDKWYSEEGSRAARVGLYNDGYMGSDSDLGTYNNRAVETEWLSHQSLTSYYGGEFSGNLEYTKQHKAYLPENAIPEMYRTHLSYINSNIYSLYKDYTFGADYDVDNVDNSAYYGENVWKFMRDHLGYRFCLRDSKLTENVADGSELELKFSVENTGFANPIRQQKAEVILENDGNFIRTEVDIDSRKWHSCETAKCDLKLQLPSGLAAERWNAYLKLSVGDNALSELPVRSVRFSNNGTWNDALGANYLGSFNIVQSEKHTNNKFYQISPSRDVTVSDGQIYTINGLCCTDGIISKFGEGDDSRFRAENEDGAKLYTWNDEDYFYVSFSIKNTAVSPVYNIQVQNADQQKWYWLYFASNGGAYFNNGTYAGSMVKYTDDSAEFRIPLGDMMGLHTGTKLEYVRVFLQDMSIENWPSCGSIKSGEVTLDGTFHVYTAERSLYLKNGETYEITAESNAKAPEYQWLHDGKPIENAVSKTYSIPPANSSTAGLYSVKITSEGGISRTVDVCRVYPSGVTGDVNCDGEFSIADAVCLQKWLIGREIDTADYTQGELDGDGILTVLDLCIMKNMLIL